MANYKVIALDFDGTTACTIPAIYHSARKMLELHGYSVDKQVVYDNFGLALPFAFRCFAGDDTIDDATIEQMIVEYNNIYKEEGERLIELFEGVPETLRKLKEAGLTIVIASNNNHPYFVRKEIDHLRF